MCGLCRDRQGAIAVMAVLMAAVFTILIGAVVDTSRMHSARARLQAAADAGLLGGVATLSTVDIGQEAQRIFEANFQSGSMGVTLTPVNVQMVAPDIYELSVTATVPTMMLEYLSANSVTFTITSRVTRGFTHVGQTAEIVLVLGNASSMASGARMDDLKVASRDLVDAVFGSASALTRVNFNLVPYDVGVNIGAISAQRSTRRNWVQLAWQSAFDTHGIVANRNSDNPPDMLNDVSDATPLASNTAFRTPNPLAHAADAASAALAPLAFGLQGKQAIHDAIALMQPAGATRTNVGVQWGWMTLSPSWQGLWDAGLPDLPRSVLSSKTVVLVTDSLNMLYTGGSTTNDDVTTLQLCNAMKAQGIVIYSIGFGAAADVNETLLQGCATSLTYYFHAPTAAALQTAMRSIGDRMVYNTIRIQE